MVLHKQALTYHVPDYWHSEHLLLPNFWSLNLFAVVNHRVTEVTCEKDSDRHSSTLVLVRDVQYTPWGFVRFSVIASVGHLISVQVLCHHVRLVLHLWSVSLTPTLISLVAAAVLISSHT